MILLPHHVQALVFLGQVEHHMLPNPVTTMEEIAARHTFMDLWKAGYVGKTDFGSGFVQVYIKSEGRAVAGTALSTI